MEHTAVNGSFHTDCQQHQRICTQICAQICLRVLCERGLKCCCSLSPSAEGGEFGAGARSKLSSLNSNQILLNCPVDSCELCSVLNSAGLFALWRQKCLWSFVWILRDFELHRITFRFCMENMNILEYLAQNKNSSENSSRLSERFSSLFLFWSFSLGFRFCLATPANSCTFPKKNIFNMALWQYPKIGEFKKMEIQFFP